MKKFYKALPTYLLYGFPFTLACMIWSCLDSNRSREVGDFSWLWEILSWNLILWFASLALSTVLLVFSQSFRESLLPRLTRLTERDEREIQITGKAARNTYLASLALLLMLLFLNSVQLVLGDLPPEEQINGKTRSLSISVKFDLLEDNKGSNGNQVNFLNLPVSKQGIILIMIMWQMGTFIFFVRRNPGSLQKI